MILLADRECPDRMTWMHKEICAFIARICLKDPFFFMKWALNMWCMDSKVLDHSLSLLIQAVSGPALYIDECFIVTPSSSQYDLTTVEKRDVKCQISNTKAQLIVQN